MNNDNGLDSTAYVLPGTHCASHPRYVLDTSNICTNDESHNIQHPVPAYFDDLMTKANGGTVVFF